MQTVADPGEGPKPPPPPPPSLPQGLDDPGLALIDFLGTGPWLLL